MIEQLPSAVQATGVPSSADPKLGVPSRRVFIRNTALVGGGTAVALLLSACSKDGDADAPAESAAAFTFPAAEVPVGGGVVLAEHSVVVTQPEEGSFFAFSAVCTHKGCVLTSVEEMGAFCGCHSSYFDISTGQPVAGPAQMPLPSVPIAVSGETLTIG